jgi:hypothetical protein
MQTLTPLDKHEALTPATMNAKAPTKTLQESIAID